MEISNQFATFLYFTNREWAVLRSLAKDQKQDIQSFLQEILDFNLFSYCKVVEITHAFHTPHVQRVLVINEHPHRIYEYLKRLINASNPMDLDANLLQLDLEFRIRLYNKEDI